MIGHASIIPHLGQLIPEITATFPSILVLYLFGSHAAGKNHQTSDVDIAVFTDGSESPTMDLELAAFLEPRLQRPVDVVIIPRVSPILQHEILSNKIRLYDKDPEKRAKLEVRSFRAYLDAIRYQSVRFSRKNGC